MQIKLPLFVIAATLAAPMLRVLAAEGDVLTATRVVHAIIKQSPFLVDTTTTVTWTQGPSISETATPTPIPDTVEGTTAA